MISVVDFLGSGFILTGPRVLDEDSLVWCPLCAEEIKFGSLQIPNIHKQPLEVLCPSCSCPIIDTNKKAPRADAV